MPISGTKVFADHHRYRAGDAARIERAAERSQAYALITTEKDARNLAGIAWSKFPAYAAIIDVAVSQEEAFLELMLRR